MSTEQQTTAQPLRAQLNELLAEEFIRLPGLFRRWELGQVLEPENDFHLEEAGTTSDGTPLFAVYRREPNAAEEE